MTTQGTGLTPRAFWPTEPTDIIKKLHAKGGWQIVPVEIRALSTTASTINSARRSARSKTAGQRPRPSARPKENAGQCAKLIALCKCPNVSHDRPARHEEEVKP